MQIFRGDVDREFFLALVRSSFEARGVFAHGFVLMTTHFHLLATPTSEESLPNAMRTVGGDYSRYFNQQYGRTGTLWEHRYAGIPIEDESYPLICLRYIEQNPVRAKMVNDPQSYRWSSYGFHALGHPCDWLSPHPTYLALGATETERQMAYRAICAEPVPAAAFVRLKRQSRLKRRAADLRSGV